MTQFSYPWPDTSTGYDPIIGDGRKITAEEYAYRQLRLFGAGVLPVGNRLAVTSPAANELAVATGEAISGGGRWYRNDAVITLTPASAPLGTSRQDSVILECDWGGTGETEQYTVRVVTKAGTSGAPPSMTQVDGVLWQDRLYNYTINDAGAISGLTDQRTYSTYSTQVATAMIQDEAVTADKLAPDVGPHIGDLKFNDLATLGGSDGRRMVIAGVAHESWVHCDGGAAVNGITIPDMRDKVVAGASATHAAGTTGGANSLNLSHWHGAGTLAAASHTHNLTGAYTGIASGSTTYYLLVLDYTNANNAAVTGNTASAMAATDMRQATRYAYCFIYVG